MTKLEDKSKAELIAIIIGCSRSIKHLKRNRKWRRDVAALEYRLLMEDHDRWVDRCLRAERKLNTG